MQIYHVTHLPKLQIAFLYLRNKVQILQLGFRGLPQSDLVITRGAFCTSLPHCPQAGLARLCLSSILRPSPSPPHTCVFFLLPYSPTPVRKVNPSCHSRPSFTWTSLGTSLLLLFQSCHPPGCFIPSLSTHPLPPLRCPSASASTTMLKPLLWLFPG